MLFFDICFSSSLRSSSNSLYRRFTVQVMSPVGETGGRETGTGALQVTPTLSPYATTPCTHTHTRYRSRCAVANKRRRGGLVEGRHDNAIANALYSQPPSPRATCTSKDTNFRSMTSTDGM